MNKISYFLVVMTLVSGCASSKLQKRVNVLDVDNVRLISENEHLRAELGDCKKRISEASSDLRKFQKILGNTLKLYEESNARIQGGKGK